MSTDKNSDVISQPAGAAHTSHFSSSLFSPAKLPKRSTSSTEKPASSHESTRVASAPKSEQAHGSGINTFTQHSPSRKQLAPLMGSMGGDSDTPSLKATSFATTHNAHHQASAHAENTAALAASSSFYAPMKEVQHAAHVRMSHGSPNRASNCSATSVVSSGARLRPSAVSRASSIAGNRAAVYGLDRLDARTGPSTPSLNQFARNSNASCLDADLDDHAIARAVAVTRSLPRELRDCARHLSAFSADCLLPAQVMAKLWKVEADHAQRLISLLGDAGLVRHATLESGAMWCVPTRTFAAALRHVFREDSAIMHASVLAVYEDQPTFTSWDKVKDDGFIVLQLMRHLAATCRLDDIRSLLLSSTWLENKTHWHGPAAVSKDFYAAASANNELASLCALLMQAYSISLPAMTAMPHSGTLLAQILMRTAAITHLSPDSLDPVFCDWWQEKVKEQETAISNNFRGLANNTFKPTPVHLLSLSTTLAQACGSTRLVIKSYQYTINAVALTETSEELVAACSDGKLRRFELQFGAKQEELSGMGLPLIDVQSCCRNRFATISEQSSVVEIWCLTEGGVIMSLPCATDPVTRLLIHPRGTTALVGTEGGEVRMFSLVDGSCELVMASADHPVTVTAINVAWNVSTALSSPIAAVGHMTGGIVVWDLMGESEDLPICKLAGHKASVTGLSFFNQGECLISSSQDGTIIVWDLLSGTRLKVFLGHSAPVNGVVVEPTQELLALSWSDDCSAIVWSLESGQARTVLKGDTSYIVSACFVPIKQPDGGSAGPTRHFQVVTSTGDGSLLVWDAQTGELLQLLSGHSQAVKNVVSSGMNLVSVGEDKTVRLWNLRSKVVDMPIAHQTGISAIQAFGNSEALVTCGVSGNMQLWDCSAASLTDSGARECLNVTHAPMFTATSTNGRLLASIAANSHTVLRDPVTLAAIHEMPPRLGTRVRSASFSGDCKLVAVVLQDSSVTIWDVPRHEIMWQPQARGAMSAVDAHHDGVNGCFLSEKGDILVTISKDCTARIWNVILRQASHVCSGHTSQVRCGWLSRDGSLLITGSEDSTARVWDTSTGEAMIVLAHNQGVTNVTGTENKRRALTCTDSSAAWLWNVVDGECTAILRDARLLVTRHSTASLAVWHVATGALVAFFACDSRVSHLACTPQGVLAAGTETGAVHFLRLPLRSGSRSFTGIIDKQGPAGPKVVHARSVQRAQGSMEKPQIARAL